MDVTFRQIIEDIDEEIGTHQDALDRQGENAFPDRIDVQYHKDVILGLNTAKDIILKHLY